jgi:hypothetical protein
MEVIELAFKTNVIKQTWAVETKMENRKNVYLVEAESEEAARLKVPKDEVVLSVKCMDGR